MFVRSIVFNFVLGICAVAGYAVAEVIVPTEEQTVLLRGSAEVRHGVRTVSGSVDATVTDAYLNNKIFVDTTDPSGIFLRFKPRFENLHIGTYNMILTVTDPDGDTIG